MCATSNHEKTTSNFEHLQSFSIHAIVIHPNFNTNVFLSFVKYFLQNHTIIFWFSRYLAMSFAYILKFVGNSFPFSSSLFILTS